MKISYYGNSEFGTSMGDMYINARTPMGAIRAFLKDRKGVSYKIHVSGKWYAYDANTDTVVKTDWRPKF
jgi:hypothetical protein